MPTYNKQQITRRYQVLADNTPILETGSKKQAEAVAQRWRQEGKTNVSVWDTRKNSLSAMFSL